MSCRPSFSFLLGLAFCLSWNSPASEPDIIKLASWNLEWLMTPATFKALKPSCTSEESEPQRSGRQLPCDVALTLERSSSDLVALARYARSLDADVIAIQEVDGPEAARLILPDYQFCFPNSNGLQNSGFAIRRGIPFRCGPHLTALAVSSMLRTGAVLRIYPGSSQEMLLLGVHLKSGCASKALTTKDRNCRLLAEQSDILQEWVKAQDRANQRFVILGDFNRDLLGQTTATLGNSLINSAQGTRYRNCTRGEIHASYIDYILLSRRLASAIVPGSFERLTWKPTDAARLKLSDHCPIAVRIRAAPNPSESRIKFTPGIFP